METFDTLLAPKGATRYIFFGGKGGVGKTTMATATAVWFADLGYKTTIVSTDPTVSLSVMFDRHIGGSDRTPVPLVPNLRGLNINPNDARGVFQARLNSVTGQMNQAFGDEMIATPCAEEMATFDQFVTFLDEPDAEVIVFDTAPTGKSLRELAMPFDWAGFLQKQIQDGKKMAELMRMDDESFANLERDRLRYDHALSVLRDRAATIFSLVVIPEKLPIEETHSAIIGLSRLGIPVQGLVVNECILPEVIEGNRFLEARAEVQRKYLAQIETRFGNLTRVRLPLLNRDVSELDTLRTVGGLLYGSSARAQTLGFARS
ncbi:MAG: TRC40/GET3/ArsA family transport-energizing ATPase [Spirochaetia bacterium]|jgi:arsenite-transporting ATPase